MSRSDKGSGWEAGDGAVMLTPENIVVYPSSTLRLHSDGYTPYFRNVSAKKDTQSFFVLPLPTSTLGRYERMNGSREVVDRR